MCWSPNGVAAGTKRPRRQTSSSGTQNWSFENYQKQSSQTQSFSITYCQPCIQETPTKEEDELRRAVSSAFKLCWTLLAYVFICAFVAHHNFNSSTVLVCLQFFTHLVFRIMAMHVEARPLRLGSGDSVAPTEEASLNINPSYKFQMIHKPKNKPDIYSCPYLRITWDMLYETMQFHRMQFHHMEVSTKNGHTSQESWLTWGFPSFSAQCMAVFFGDM